MSQANSTDSTRTARPPIAAGQRYERLTAIEFADRVGRRPRPRWRFRCECGTEVVVLVESVRLGHTRSCGCIRVDLLKKHRWAYKDGRTSKPELRIWRNMTQRCYNPQNIGFRHYGGRDIAVCERWRNDFAAFFADMGPRPSPAHSIERINNDLGYSPDNCIWVSPKEQQRNKRTSRMVLFCGREMCFAEACELAGIDYYTAWRRLKRGWPVDKALSLKVRFKRRRRFSPPRGDAICPSVRAR